MKLEHTPEYLTGLVRELCELTGEVAWVEFKLNNAEPQMIGQRILALANSAALNGKTNAYMVWGIENETHAVVGTSFIPTTAKKGNQPLESWLLNLLSPKIHFRFNEVEVDGKKRRESRAAGIYRGEVKDNFQKWTPDVTLESYNK